MGNTIFVIFMLSKCAYFDGVDDDYFSLSLISPRRASRAFRRIFDMIFGIILLLSARFSQPVSTGASKSLPATFGSDDFTLARDDVSHGARHARYAISACQMPR